MDALYEFDFSILDFIQAHWRTAPTDRLMPAVTALGDVGVIWIALGLVFLIFRSRRKNGVEILLALLLGLLSCNLLLKPWLARPRPFTLNPAIRLLIEAPSDFSFPSGHTAASFEAAGVMLLGRVPGRYWALALALLISFSRLYLYVHYPSDVLGGAALGFINACLAYVLVEFFAQKLDQKRLRLESK